MYNANQFSGRSDRSMGNASSLNAEQFRQLMNLLKSSKIQFQNTSTTYGNASRLSMIGKDSKFTYLVFSSSFSVRNIVPNGSWIFDTGHQPVHNLSIFPYDVVPIQCFVNLSNGASVLVTHVGSMTYLIA